MLTACPILPFLCSQPYALQPMGHACPTRRPERVVLVRIPLGLSPADRASFLAQSR
jgi:hypothetical protein